MIWAILIFLAVLALACYRPQWAIYLSIFCLPGFLIRFTFFGLPTTLLELMLLANIFAFFFRRKFSATIIKTFYRSGYFWPAASFLFFATVAVAVGPNLLKALGLWRAYFVEPILFFIVVSQTIKTKKELASIFWAFTLSALYCALIAGWQIMAGWQLAGQAALLPQTVGAAANWLGYFGYPQGFGFHLGELTWWYIPKAFLQPNFSVDRAVSVFGYPNGLGLYLGPLIILTTGFLISFKDKAWQQAIKLLTIVLSLAALVLAQSMGALLAVIICGFLWLVINKKTRRWALAAAGLMLVIFWLVTFTGYYDKVLHDKLYSGFVRSLIWQESWQMLKDNWLMGAGLWGYQTKIAPYHLPTFEIFLFPHNFILNFWSEIGLFGLLSFLWLCGKFIVHNTAKIFKFGEKNIISLALVLAVVQMLVHGLIDVPYFRNDLAVMFWLVLALGAISEKLKEEIS